jgi:ABC-type amino acid transport substrate-binding protein
LAVAGLVTLCGGASLGEDVVRIVAKQSDIDRRGDYKIVLLKALFDHTAPEFGSYRIENIKPITRKRGYVEMLEGRLVNLYFAPADQQWEDNLLPIRVPIRKGLLNYRLLLIDKADIGTFAAIRTADELKKLKVGLRAGWTTTKVMKALDFQVVTAPSYDSVFKMLVHRRFSFIPRGVNEIFGEVEARKDEAPNIVIEPSLALFMPMPVYIYVSPKEPRLARRIEAGFRAIRQNGEFDRLFERFFARQIELANLDQRRILWVGNPLLSEKTPFDDPELWFYAPR